jgi:hypothetical protein
VLPDGSTRTVRYLDYFFAPGLDDGWRAEFMELDALVGAEDRVLVERVQAGIGSGALAEGRLLPETERLVAHFQAFVLAACASSSS